LLRALTTGGPDPQTQHVAFTVDGDPHGDIDGPVGAVAGDLGAIDVGEVVHDVPGRQPFRVKAEHGVVEPDQPTRALGDHGRV
jgi:hypothetical protein